MFQTVPGEDHRSTAVNSCYNSVINSQLVPRSNSSSQLVAGKVVLCRGANSISEGFFFEI